MLLDEAPQVGYARVSELLLKMTLFPMLLACVAGVERGRGRGNLGARESVWGARGGKERNACKDAIVLAVFYAQILSVKIVIGQT